MRRLHCVSVTYNTHNVTRPLRTIGENVMRGHADPQHPAGPSLLCLSASPVAGPFSLYRHQTKKGPKQWLALRAEWLCRSSTNPPPSLTETQPALVLLKRG